MFNSSLLKTKHKSILHDDAVKIVIDLLATAHPEDLENNNKMRNLVQLASEIGVDQAVDSIFPEIQKTPILTELVEAWLALTDIDSQDWMLENYSEMLLSDEALLIIEEHLETSRPRPLSLHLLLIHLDFLKDCRENGIEIASKNRRQQIMSKMLNQ